MSEHDGRDPALSAFPLDCCAETDDNFTVWAADKDRPLYSFRMSERLTVETLVKAINNHVATRSPATADNESRQGDRPYVCDKHNWMALRHPCPLCRGGDAPRICHTHGWAHLRDGCPKCGRP